jgi:hypothetical protein
MKQFVMKTAQNWCVRFLMVVCVGGLLSSEAWATILLATTNTIPQSSPPLADPAFLDLSSAGGLQTTFAFATSVPNTRVVIRFNAECAVGGGASNWLDVNIIVDPAGAPAPLVVPPTDSDNALCAGNGTASNNDGWVSAMSQAVLVIPTVGVHTLRVQVDGMGAGATWRIDDLSLVVESQ